MSTVSDIESGYEASTEAQRAFQQLKTRLHRQMVDAMDLSKAGQLPEHELRKQLRALASHLCDMHSSYLPESEREQMVNEIMDEMYGFGPLEPLMNDPEISDVLVNGADTVFIERNGLLEQTDIQFADNNHLLHLIQRLVGRAGRRIDEVSPMVDAKLADGSRLHAVIPPLTQRGPTLSIRRFGSKAVEFEDMVRSRSLTREMADFLIAAVKGRLNILLSGGTGAGKTTMLNQLGRFIPVSERVITIEETAELQLQQADVVGLETRLPNVEGSGAVTQRELLRNSLRMRPDRIIVGESRGSEVLEMLQAMNTGHDGSMSTVHANDTRDALDRLELMIALSGADLSPVVARRYIASAIHMLVHVTRLSTGERKVTRISELAGTSDGEYNVEDIFVYRMTGITSDGRAEGAFYATGYEPECVRRMAARGHHVPLDLFTARELIAGGEYIVPN